MPDQPSSTENVLPAPAATVVLLRDAGEGLEVLMVRRNAKLVFHGGAWVFPGGRVDPADHADTSDALDAARNAAVREAREETDVSIAASELVPISRWITPRGFARRFDTWFFAARVGDTEIRVDGEEIQDHRWITPEQAIDAQAAGQLDLPPPTYVTLLGLVPIQSVETALAQFAGGPVETFDPRPRRVEHGICSLYDGDVAYAGGELEQPGPRHRLWILREGLRYEREA